MEEDQLEHVSIYAHLIGRGLAVVGEPVLLEGKGTFRFTVKGVETGVYALEFRSNTASGRVVCVCVLLARASGKPSGRVVCVCIACGFCCLPARVLNTPSGRVLFLWRCGFLLYACLPFSCVLVEACDRVTVGKGYVPCMWPLFGNSWDPTAAIKVSSESLNMHVMEPLVLEPAEIDLILVCVYVCVCCG